MSGNRRKLIHSLCKDTAENIVSPLTNDKDLTSIGVTSRLVHNLFANQLLDRGTRKLLQLVVDTEWSKIEKVAKANPRLISHEITIKDANGNLEKISPLKYAFKFLDEYSWKIFQQYLPPDEFIRQAREMTSHFDLESILRPLEDEDKRIFDRWLTGIVYELTDEMEPEAGKLCVREIEGKLAYTVKTPQGIVIRDVPLEELKAPDPLNRETLQPLRYRILAITFANGHTYPRATDGDLNLYWVRKRVMAIPNLPIHFLKERYRSNYSRDSNAEFKDPTPPKVPGPDGLLDYRKGRNIGSFKTCARDFQATAIKAREMADRDSAMYRRLYQIRAERFQQLLEVAPNLDKSIKPSPG